jgi:hypothetical protein
MRQFITYNLIFLKACTVEYDRYEKLESENPTIGILLCKEKNDALVEITLPKDANIYATEYKLYLPDKKLL